jgi:DUF971 family protein
MLQLVKLKKISDLELSLLWNDGAETRIAVRRLRDECPCANCKGESVLFESYAPVKLPVATPGMYELKKIEVIGNYSIQPVWGDGHNTGLYAWDYLRQISKPVESR